LFAIIDATAGLSEDNFHWLERGTDDTLPSLLLPTGPNKAETEPKSTMGSVFAVINTFTVPVEEIKDESAEEEEARLIEVARTQARQNWSDRFVQRFKIFVVRPPK